MKTTYSSIFYTLTIAALACSCSSKTSYDATGTFEATTVTVSAEATGKILSFDTAEGQTVSEGQTICQIDDTALMLQKRTLEQQQKALLAGKPDQSKQLAAIKEQIAKQKTELARVQALVKDDAATDKQLDDVKSQLAVLESQYDATLSSLGKNTASIDENVAVLTTQIDQLENNISKCDVTAPISGTILTKYMEAGELSAAGKPVVKIADTDNMILRAYFTSDQLPSISLGQKVKVFADFGGERRYEYEGTITWISSESEFTPKSIQTKSTRASLVYAVKIAVKNDGKLKIGLYAEVEL